ncbi:hypothetical protein lbkm_0446 [Lachnospiraceae bacterium KM106-2]|nr:hypothetical protein lbkm_0446 [Lachnospiraceae bacterium KM106-2]
MSNLDREKIAEETLQIIKNGFYVKNDVKIQLPHADYKKVQLFNPQTVDAIVNDEDEMLERCLNASKECAIHVENMDSYEAVHRFDMDHALVMNFANAVTPGGGFLHGANAQEESLCRNSTLYKSIGSVQAKEMYDYNREIQSPIDSDYMILSPEVCVFRDSRAQLLDHPYMTAVLTIPAPNLNGRAKGLDRDEIRDVMLHKIKTFLYVAARYGYRKLVLGAWGCGAFGHDARTVAGYFSTLLIKEKYWQFFDEIVFAVYDHSDEQYNYQSFAEVFQDYKYLGDTREVVAKADDNFILFSDLMPCVSGGFDHVNRDYDIGYTQGIFLDGKGFIAELFNLEGMQDKQVAIVMPEKIFIGLSEKEYVADFKTGSEETWNIAICQDIKDKKEIVDPSVIEQVSNYLEENQVMDFNNGFQAFGCKGKDLNGENVIVMGYTLGEGNRVICKTNLEFWHYEDKWRRMRIKCY